MLSLLAARCLFAAVVALIALLAFFLYKKYLYYISTFTRPWGKRKERKKRVSFGLREMKIDRHCIILVLACLVSVYLVLMKREGHARLDQIKKRN